MRLSKKAFVLLEQDIDWSYIFFFNLSKSIRRLNCGFAFPGSFIAFYYPHDKNKQFLLKS